MLEIRPIHKYAVARYPRQGQFVRPPKLAGVILRDAAALMTLAALLESCSSTHTSGVPLPPQFLTETEARRVINQVFAGSNIYMAPDEVVAVQLSPADSVHLSLDGFNDSLQVGYEYITSGDRDSFTAATCHHLDSLAYVDAPHILIVDPELRGIYNEARLQDLTQNFLDSLKAHGII